MGAAAGKKDGMVSYNDGFFRPWSLNPFRSSYEKCLDEDFHMTDFENLLKSKPQDIHKRMKLSSNDNGPSIAHLSLASVNQYNDLYDRFDDFEDPTYLIN